VTQHSNPTIRRTGLLRSAAFAALALGLGAMPVSADVSDVLQADPNSGAPPGYDNQHYTDPDFQPDQGLLSYNDPYAGQSDEALKAKIGPLNTQAIFDDSSGYNPNRSQGTEVEQALKTVFVKQVVR
jgi:hypothetical protein